MAEFPDERQLMLEARSHLDEWTNGARRDAYAELFEGEDALLTDEELRVLDALDSALEREGGDGVWGTDRYGIHATATGSPETSLGVVCVYHPQVTEDTVLRGVDGLDDETEERINAALWRYANRVATLVEERLDEYVREKRE